MNYNANTVFQPGTGKSGTARVWNSGPPPHIGWWNASISSVLDRWRWWDGTNWSVANSSGWGLCLDVESPEDQCRIKWTDYWPENARVPRVDPSDPKNVPVVAFINAAKNGDAGWARTAWNMYRGVQTPAAAGCTRTVREMKERMKPGITSDVPARMSSNGQVPTPQIPDYRELTAAPTRELVRELFRRLG